MLFRETLRSAGFTLTTLMAVACVITVTKACYVEHPDDLEWFLTGDGEWMIPVLFNNRRAEIVAREINLAASINELQWRLGLTEENMENIRICIWNSLSDKERPLMELRMPERSWPESQNFFTSLVKDCRTGFYSPIVDTVAVFLSEQRRWMMPKLFNDNDPATVAQAFNLTNNISGVQRRLGLTPENVENLRTAFHASLENDERPLLAIGMPERSWGEVRYLFVLLFLDGFHED